MATLTTPETVAEGRGPENVYQVAWMPWPPPPGKTKVYTEPIAVSGSYEEAYAEMVAFAELRCPQNAFSERWIEWDYACWCDRENKREHLIITWPHKREDRKTDKNLDPSRYPDPKEFFALEYEKEHTTKLGDVVYAARDTPLFVAKRKPENRDKLLCELIREGL